MPLDFPPPQENINPVVLAYGYSREESVPYPAYPSGNFDKGHSIYANPTPENTNPLLIIEDDIVGSDGRGLKKGFYEVRADIENDFLLLYQSGKLKMKAPILSVEQRKNMPPIKDSKKKKWWWQKEKKNYRGVDSKDFIYQRAQLMKDEEKNCYIIIWDRANTRIKAMLKLI